MHDKYLFMLDLSSICPNLNKKNVAYLSHDETNYEAMYGNDLGQWDLHWDEFYPPEEVVAVVDDDGGDDACHHYLEKGQVFVRNIQ